MGERTHQDEVRMKVQSFMAQVYRETQCSVFVPEQLVDEGLNKKDKVLRALRTLEDDGDLRGYATLRCAEGHDFFGGTPDAVAHCTLRECTFTQCFTHRYSEAELADESYQPRVVVRYALSRRYRTVLDDASQKKTPQITAIWNKTLRRMVERFRCLPR
jgi:hypothetical protein